MKKTGKKRARKTARPSPKKKKAPPRKRPAPKKKKASPDDSIGRVVAFFRIPVVAVVRVARGSLRMGDRIWIKGHTTDLKETVASMQINHQPVSEAKKGQEAGVKVSSRARIGDRVYLLSA